MLVGPGQHLSHYRLIEKIGEGGMGVVWKAYDEKLRRDVALKILPAKLVEDPESRRRLLREARSAAAINHPNISTVYEVDEAGGAVFIAMELVKGKTLRSLLGEKPLAIPEVLRIATEIAEGLVAAHQAAVIHRDLKPENVLIRADGHVKVLDFGLAKVLQEQEELSGSKLSEAETRTEELTREGRVLGTPFYMSPEQLRGEKVDARTDIFATGIVLYEMATGQRPFEAKLMMALVADIQHKSPTPPRQVNPSISPRLEEVILKCLEKEPDRRYPSAGDLLADLEQLRAQARYVGIGASIARLARKPAVWIAGVIAVLGLAVGLFAYGRHARQLQWATEEVLPEIRRLHEEGDQNNLEAYRLAEQAEPYLDNDPEFQALLSEIAAEISIVTTPSGATVHVKPYEEPEAPWELIGETPIDHYRLPVVFMRWKVEKPGFETVIDVQMPGKWEPETDTVLPETIEWKLDEAGTIPGGMVRVSGGDDLPDFWIDKHEVTNRQFKEFMDAGGYRNPEYWKFEFVKAGRVLPHAEALRGFVDSTGRPGPGTWEAGDYPKGQDEFPVTGVSWYEAAAYAEFAGKSLPTLRHWRLATGYQVDGAQWIFPRLLIPLSNFDGERPQSVGSTLAMTPYGASDMAGNAREWCWNASEAGRCLRGGAWNDEVYMYGNITQAPTFDRSEKNGFRCVEYLDHDAIPAEVFGPHSPQAVRDLYEETPVSDEIFRVYREHYNYDASDLDAKVEERIDRDDWIREKITFNAPYGEERVVAQLFLPKAASPPYQVVVYFAGDAAQSAGPIDELEERREFKNNVSFMVETGRAVFYTAYQGTHERKDGAPSSWDGQSHEYANFRIQQVKDFRRSLDYLESRPDIDPERMAFYGFSRGGAEANLLLAVDDRFKTAISHVGGMGGPRRPEVDHLNFTPRVRTPMLMLNGRYDLAVPYQTSAKPMFDLLGTPEEHKVLKVYESDHFIERKELIKETLNWLDTYLGPVEVAAQ